MKRITLTLILLALGLVASAQVDSAALIQAQQQHQNLRDLQDSIALEQRNANRQVEELAKQDALVTKQIKKAQKAERRELIGRKGRLAIAPYVGYGTWSLDESALYYGGNFSVGIGAAWHHPIAPKWNLNLGLNYQWNQMQMYNHATFDEASQLLTPHIPTTWGREDNYFGYSTVELPMFLARVFQDGSEVYFGLRLGVRVLASYHRDYFVDNNGELDDEDDNTPVAFGKGNQLNRLSCKLVVGTEEKGFLFAPGCEAYFDLIPAIRQMPQGQKCFINEWGVRINL